MKVLLLCLICLTFSAQMLATDNIVVVVNKNNPNNSISKKQLIDLYMGKYVAFPDGSTATPYDLTKDSHIRKYFYNKLTGSTISQINAYWSRIKFTGRVSQPQKVNISQAKKNIERSINAIAYIRESDINKNLKVIYTVD